MGFGWTSYFLLWGVWDTAATAVLSGIAMAMITIWAVAWPRLTKAGVEAENIRRDAAVAAATEYWRQQCDKSGAKCETVEKALRAEIHRLEDRLNLEVARSSKYRLLWEMATGRTPSFSQEDIPVAAEPDPDPEPDPEPEP